MGWTDQTHLKSYAQSTRRGVPTIRVPPVQTNVQPDCLISSLALLSECTPHFSARAGKIASLDFSSVLQASLDGAAMAV